MPDGTIPPHLNGSRVKGEPLGPTIAVRLMEVLSDGQPHSVAELMPCLDDPLSGIDALRMRISVLRKSLRPKGLDVMFQAAGGYRLVRLLSSPYRG